MRNVWFIECALHARQKDGGAAGATLTTVSASTPPPALSWAPPADAQAFVRLADLVARLGPATEKEAMGLCAAVPRDALIARGAQVATPRVAADALRVLGRAAVFFQGAPADLVATVRLSPNVVRIGAWSAREAERRDEAARAHDADKRAGRRATASVAASAEKSAAGLAEQLSTTLLQVAGGDAHAAERIRRASQPAAEGHQETSRGRVLAALVDEGRGLLASDDAGVAARRALFQLDAAYLDRCAAAAAQAREAARAAAAPAVALGRSHADVDLWDGVALTVLDAVVAAFAKANALDARVPKLAYVALRARTGRKRKGAAKGDAKKDDAAKKDEPAGGAAKPDA